jgi:DNA-binding NarL/FixJ family response regulator
LEKTRVILMDMPPMLRQIVRGLVSTSEEFELVDEPDGEAAVATIQASGTCVVITGRESAAARASIGSLLGTHPEVPVIALSNDGRSGTLFQPGLEERPLGELSPEALRAAIRGSVA